MINATNIAIIARATLRESIRSRHLLSIALLAAALVLTAMCFGMVTIGDQTRVIKDFGLCAASIAVAAYAAISGAAFLEKEISRKTLYNILSKAVTRSDFILGKWMGLVASAAILSFTLFMTTALLAFLVSRSFDILLAVAFGYAFLETLLVCSFAIFFSSIVVTPALSGLFTIALFLAGRSSGYFLYFVERKETTEPLTTILNGLFWCLPNLAEINVANGIVFGQSPTLQHFAYSACYSISYSCLLLLSSCMLFSRRNFL